MKFTDLIISYPNVLGDDVCDEIISRFESDTRKEFGRTGSGYSPDVKQSTDLLISGLDGWEAIDNTIFERFSPYVEKYNNFLLDKTKFNPLEVTDSGYQIQKTIPGGFYTWHNDYSTKVNRSEILSTESSAIIKSRYATYIFYLNDVTNDAGGRTKFYFGNEHTITPKKDTLLIFPASILYTHCGESLISGDKYIMTGWLYENSTLCQLL